MKNDSLSAKDWLEKAENDLKIAEAMFDMGKFYDDVCFHCQQTAEKSLKAFLVYHREVPRKVHMLKDLLKDCLKYDPSLNEVLPDLEKLDKFYIPTRYPFKLTFTKGKAAEAIRAAKEVISRIKEKIK
jgi:HEPN domain-containing protein